jgi:hypothetical protein
VTAAELSRFGRRYPAVGRAVVSVVCAVTAPFADPPAGVGLAVAAAVVVVAWHLVLLALMLPERPGCRWFGRVFAVDIVAKCLLCLAQPLLVAPHLLAASLGWVSPVVSFALVTAQFWLRPLPAAAAAVAIPAAFVTGVAASPGLTVADGLFVGGGAWMVVEAVLARLLWRLLQRGAREADRLLQARFAAERAAATAAARRADQRAHWATVHDTSASTLLMIGLGEVSGAEEWLPGQVRRDIALLGGAPPDDHGAGGTDVAAALRETTDRARVRVEADLPAGVTAPPEVVTALSGAAAEALENVRRHAGTGTARLVLRGGAPVTAGTGAGAGAVEVTVADDGPGFDPAAVGSHRFGLAWSVRDRMHAVGGLAVVESAPGRGTVVRLRWPA